MRFPNAEYIARLAGVGCRGVVNLELTDLTCLERTSSDVLADIVESLARIDGAMRSR
jgi:hypothetical protein